DAHGNVYGLVDGDLLQWAPGQTAATLLNTGATGGQRGNVVSFQVGNDTVAWMLGNQDPDLARAFVSYANGANPARVTDNNSSGLLAVYDVAADGSVVPGRPPAGPAPAGPRPETAQLTAAHGGADRPGNG